MKKQIMTILTVLCVLTFLAGCGEKRENLTGTWASEDGSESIELYSDGTGILYDLDEDEQYSLSWIAEDGKLKFDVDLLLTNFAVSYDYGLQKNTLTLTDSDSESTVYTREE